MAFAIWDVTIHDLLERPLNFSFFVTLAHDNHLIGMDILTLGTLDCPGNSLSLPCPGDEQFIIPTYDDPPTLSSPRTYLSLFPNHSRAVTSTIQTGIALRSYFTADRRHIPKSLSLAHISKRLAHRLHSYSHLPKSNIKKVCKRAGILTPHLASSFRDVTRHCTACAGTGRLQRTMETSLTKVLVSFNENIQVDLLYISELSNLPTLHIVDTATSFSECALLPSREMPDIISALDRRWFSVYGAPANLGGDVEFSRSSKFRDFLKYYMTSLEARPARRHNKSGSVEGKDGIIRHFPQKLLRDS